MDQSADYKLKIDSNNTSLSHLVQEKPKPKYKYNKCKGCNKKRKFVNEIYQICLPCYKAKTVTLSGNKVIDDFINNILDKRNTKINLEFVPYDRFKDVEFVAEGGFSKIYKANWVGGPIFGWDKTKKKPRRYSEMIVALKELNNSKNIEAKELNELKIIYNYIIKNNVAIRKSSNINKYYGITQNPTTENFMIITEYYKGGDLAHYITKDFFNISWKFKLESLEDMATALRNLHDANIVHKDYHSGNIFISIFGEIIRAITGDFGISKSAIEASDDDKEIYGIIPYVAPEVFQGQKYTEASDIYSFGMIMWEFMVGRRPFWDKSHDSDLIIEICDGLRPPIVTNAPDGYIELMQKCWHSDPNERPTANELYTIFNYDDKLCYRKNEKSSPTKIINSSNIGPVTTNNPGAIYKSRSLSIMISSASSTRSLRSQSIITGFEGKRKFSNLIENNNENNNEDKVTKKLKFCNNKNDDYLIKELEFDIDINFNTSNDNSK
ncbi:hypothetical protein RclHR1_01510018 [Rhizophagus clarus]|uniref:Protein kinase domain-containing protein n=1 Tax=Rhizophagus clarus TaxID=94130 RepID=A0A2Z6QED8_9GLOM|nr:hypothetical protein RclHR1_01510018 [Rhizophagus clarus]